ncbi:hypothetical protein [Altericroceibacterium endophyticum]|uniref:DUF4815 domain-containing protein n=1 Tax=Altericroceibacterium endophyticum TaxID=1808508 RepID=A0A6I4T3X5_9SPHN|nr:hypothetical protein [Altericroceibacterium endophyticum]MXO64851.1 hypothetical protein [Altericroceibacterium endophyticum]
MESKVIYRQDMDADPEDFNKQQEFARRSIDHIVADGITDQRKYAGFAVAATSVTEITVQPGRLYSGGKVFNRADEFTRDFTTSLPVVGRKIVSMLVSGQEIETDIRSREFLINEETNQAEPQQVAMEQRRAANLDTVAGEESADPVAPLPGAGYLEIARIELTPAGIASVTMLTGNRVVGAQDLDTRMLSMEAFKARTGPQVQSLSADIAALTAGQASVVSLDMYGRTLGRLAVLEAKADVPQEAVDSSADFLLDDGGSDLTYAGSHVRIEEGMRFPVTASTTGSLQIFDALNPRAKMVNGMLFPAYTLAERMRVGPVTGEVAVSSYSYATHEMVQKTVSRTRIRYGRARRVSSSIAWLKNGLYDAAALAFRRLDEDWAIPVALWNRAQQLHFFRRYRYCWIDTYEEPYWEEVTTDHSVNGTQVAETFLNANDMWLGAVGLNFTSLAEEGPLTLAICETDRGLPQLDKVVGRTTMARADLTVGEVQIPIGPVFLTGGQRYAIVIMTAADHRIGTVAGSAFPEGTFFYVLDGAYQQGDATRDLAFSLHSCQFSAARAVIDLAPLELAGGIADIDVLAPAVIPGSTQLSYEVQIAGTWYPLEGSEDLPLGAGGSLPPLLPFRAVFTGTPDVMPAMSLNGSQIILSRLDKDLTHISDIRTLPGAGSDRIQVTLRLEDFDETTQDCSCQLLTGAAFGTVEEPVSTLDRTVDGDALERVFTFELDAPVTEFRIKTTGHIASALAPFHVAMRKDWAI